MHLKCKIWAFFVVFVSSFSPSSGCIPGAGTDTATPVAEMICAAAVPAVKYSYRTPTVSMHVLNVSTGR